MNRKRTLRLATYSDADYSSQVASLSTRVLAQQNRVYQATGGVSEGCRVEGFRPAFLDRSTGITWLSRFSNGRIAPLHVLDGLPEELIAKRDIAGHAAVAKACVVAGFLRDGLFYTREQAASAVAH